MDYKKTILSMSNNEILVLKNFDLDISNMKKTTNLSEDKLLHTLSLLEERNLVEVKRKENLIFELNQQINQIKDIGTPEFIVLNEIKTGTKNIDEINLDENLIKSSIGILKKNDLCLIGNNLGKLSFTINENGLKFLENFVNPFLEIEKNLDELKSRKFLTEKKKIFYEIVKKNDLDNLIKEILENYSNIKITNSLTYEMLKDKTYENYTFKYFDTEIKTQNFDIGRYHPMLKANDILSEVFVEMGFCEMEGPIVESEFWCFDALWIPQDHPARDEQDTFFLEDLAEVDENLSKEVSKLHENGIKKGHTSKGTFSQKITRRTILRTHSTSTTFRKLYELGLKHKKGEHINGKYFYVAHNFRNEAVDATHLAEFFQCEGIVIGDDLTLTQLMGVLRDFYRKFGIEKLKFKPTFNPYTEPSMEIHYFDEKLKKWYSIGNSGIFRPECLKAFGLENKTIYGWGLGASRVATLLCEKSSMRDITGNTCDFNYLKSRKVMNRNFIR